MVRHLREIIHSYDPDRPLEEASTPSSAWYTDPRVYELERRAVFHRTWQMVGRVEQVAEPRQFLTVDVAGEPCVVIRGEDKVLRAFFNVCRHHAAIVVIRETGRASVLQCPYHGWTYALDGRLKAASAFEGVRGFDLSGVRLAPIQVDTWENFVFVNLDEQAPSLDSYLAGLARRVAPLGLPRLRFAERRRYEIGCNWKVFVDNYLDGGYHVPYAHKGLGSVLDCTRYSIECQDRFCVQTSPISSGGGDRQTASVRKGETAYYFWLYPNFMLNWYEGVLDTNLVLPLSVDRTMVVFDFYFADTSAAGESQNRQSIAVAERIQQEDIDLCESVQRGLQSQAYDVGRLSVRHEAGEHLFHRLLYDDLSQCTARTC